MDLPEPDGMPAPEDMPEPLDMNGGDEMPEPDNEGDGELSKINNQLSDEQKEALLKYAKSMLNGNGNVNEIAGDILGGQEEGDDERKAHEPVKNDMASDSNPFISGR